MDTRCKLNTQKNPHNVMDVITSSYVAAILRVCLVDKNLDNTINNTINIGIITATNNKIKNSNTVSL